MTTISYINNCRVSSKQTESSCLPACKMTHEGAIWSELGISIRQPVVQSILSIVQGVHDSLLLSRPGPCQYLGHLSDRPEAEGLKEECCNTSV